MNKTCPSCGFPLNLETDQHCAKCGASLQQPAAQQMDQELKQYIDGSRASGMNDAEIRQKLLAAGWDASTVDRHFGGATTPVAPGPEMTKEIHPALAAIFNIPLFSVGYLYLRMYGRVFIALIVFVLAVTFVDPYTIFFLYPAVIFDSFRLAKSIEKGKRELPEKKPLLMGLTIAFITVFHLVFFFMLITGLFFLRSMFRPSYYIPPAP